MRSKAIAGALVGIVAAWGLAGPARGEGPKGVGTEVDRLVAALRKEPVLRPHGCDRFRMFVVDVETGEATAVVDEPDKGLAYCGSAWWSKDGGRLLFDCTPLTLWHLSRMKMIERSGDKPKVTDLGAGNCPSLSPDGTRVAFLLNPDAEPGAESGVWVMKADGSDRQFLGSYGRPRWSPDGKRLLVVGFGRPSNVSLLDPDGGPSRPIKVPDLKLFSIPTWAGDGTIVAAVGEGVDADAVALIDVSVPEGAKVKETLWKKGDGGDYVPADPVYSAAKRRCVFVGKGEKGSALYVVEAGKAGPPRRLEPEGFDRAIGDLAFSPDGRYVAFHTDNPDRAGERKPRPQEVKGPKAEGESAKLVEALRRAPVLRPNGSDRCRMFLMDLAKGEETPVVDEPDLSRSFCGSFAWSADGRTIVFDATPIGLYQLAHLRSVEVADGRPKLTDYGPGNCPNPSPDGKRLAYLVNEGGDAKEQPGVWVMKSDNSDHRFLGSYGRPRWSPDGKRLLIASFFNPIDLALMDPDSGRVRPLAVDGRKLFLVPSWAGEGTVVAVLGGDAPDAVALLDVADAEEAKVKEVLWKRGDGPDVAPSDPVFDPSTGRCVFAGTERGGMALYAVERGKPGPARRVEPGAALDPVIADLALSPDGRYLLFRSNQAARRPR